MVFTTLDILRLKSINDYESINSVNPLYLMIGEVIGHIKENNKNKYLVCNSTDENKEILKKYGQLWDGTKNKIETINNGK